MSDKIESSEPQDMGSGTLGDAQAAILSLMEPEGQTEDSNEVVENESLENEGEALDEAEYEESDEDLDSDDDDAELLDDSEDYDSDEDEDSSQPENFTTQTKMRTVSLRTSRSKLPVKKSLLTWTNLKMGIHAQQTIPRRAKHWQKSESNSVRTETRFSLSGSNTASY